MSIILPHCYRCHIMTSVRIGVLSLVSGSYRSTEFAFPYSATGVSIQNIAWYLVYMNHCLLQCWVDHSSPCLLLSPTCNDIVSRSYYSRVIVHRDLLRSASWIDLSWFQQKHFRPRCNFSRERLERNWCFRGGTVPLKVRFTYIMCYDIGESYRDASRALLFNFLTRERSATHCHLHHTTISYHKPTRIHGFRWGDSKRKPTIVSAASFKIVVDIACTLTLAGGACAPRN